MMISNDPEIINTAKTASYLLINIFILILDYLVLFYLWSKIILKYKRNKNNDRELTHIIIPTIFIFFVIFLTFLAI